MAELYTIYKLCKVKLYITQNFEFRMIMTRVFSFTVVGLAKESDVITTIERRLCQ